MILEVEEQDFTFSVASAITIFSKVYLILSHTKFQIYQTFSMQTFFNVIIIV